VIYSVADMQQPGSFNPAALAEMNTNGLLFFMPLPPLAGSAEVNFKLLLNDVNSIANNMQGYVFDERGKLFDDESRAYYLAMVHQANQ
jgi:cell division protein ZipA